MSEAPTSVYTWTYPVKRLRLRTRDESQCCCRPQHVTTLLRHKRLASVGRKLVTILRSVFLSLCPDTAFHSLQETSHDALPHRRPHDLDDLLRHTSQKRLSIFSSAKRPSTRTISAHTHVYTLRAFGKEVISEFLVGCLRIVQLAAAHVRFDSRHAFCQ